MLKDKWLHTLDHGKIDRQGRIIDEDTNWLLIQWFSWVDGEPTFQEIFRTDWLMGARLYPDFKAWRSAGDKQAKDIS